LLSAQTLGGSEVHIMNLQSWAHWSEITASFAVVVTLIFLLVEVGNNTRAIERQANMDRSASISASFLTTPDLAAILAKVKAVDGLPLLTQAFSERYDLSVEQSILWVRHLDTIWMGLEGDYLHSGPSDLLDIIVEDLVSYPDEQMYLEHVDALFTADFKLYVESIRAAR
jgi:hypothetical protein